jgi:hypothetical protein
MPRKIKLRTESDVEEMGVDLEEWKKWAAKSIEGFFKDKKYHCGGRIPPHLLLSEDNIKTVMGTTIETLSKWEEHHIYPRLYVEKDQISKRDVWTSELVSFGVYYTIQLIHNLCRLGIPKQFQFGMMLLYYKFCKGFEIPPPPDRILL